MHDLRSILVVVDRSTRDAALIEKAVAFAQRFSARIELFLCDAEHEYQLRHSYDPMHVAESRAQCLADAGAYLASLRVLALRGISAPGALTVTCDAICASPLYEGILQKIVKASPDLVMKSPAGEHPGRRLTLSDNDWQLARTCPVPLMLVNRAVWSEPWRLAAAVDVSSGETPGLARAIVHMSEYLQIGSKGSLEVLSCRRSEASEAERQDYERKLAELVAEIRLPSDSIHMLEGNPDHVLPAFAATRHYDVLMLGALTHRPGLAPLVGTLTSRLVEALDCDFILVKASKHTQLASERGRATAAAPGR
jgi:universal stress protein E